MTKAAAKKRSAVQSPDPARIVDLNFKVPFEFRKRVKRFALEHDLKLIDVLRIAFERLEREGL